MKKAIIIDIDGTLVKVGDRNVFDASKCHLTDTPIKPVVNLVKTYFDNGFEIIFITGRNEKDMKSTNQQIIDIFDGKIGYQLYMRENKDFRPDFEFKGEIIDRVVKDKYVIEFAIEDRPQMVDYYRTRGIFTFAVEYEEHKKRKK